jgi:uncharacterized lipoprotein YmbA
MKIASITLLLLVVGCSSTPVMDTHYYLLREDVVPSTRALKPSADYAFGNVAIAAYIDQSGLPLQLANGEIRPALLHQWAEPMRESVRHFLQKHISNAMGEDLFSAALSDAEMLVEIRLDQLHGTVAGDAIIFAYWWLKQDGKIIESYQFGETIALQTSGYDALAAAEKSLLKKLAEHIGTTLNSRE